MCKLHHWIPAKKILDSQETIPVFFLPLRYQPTGRPTNESINDHNQSVITFVLINKNSIKLDSIGFACVVCWIVQLHKYRVHDQFDWLMNEHKHNRCLCLLQSLLLEQVHIHHPLTSSKNKQQKKNMYATHDTLACSRSTFYTGTVNDILDSGFGVRLQTRVIPVDDIGSCVICHIFKWRFVLDQFKDRANI